MNQETDFRPFWVPQAESEPKWTCFLIFSDRPGDVACLSPPGLTAAVNHRLADNLERNLFNKSDVCGTVCVCVGSITWCRCLLSFSSSVTSVFCCCCDFVFQFCQMIFISLIQQISVSDSFSHIHVCAHCDYDKFLPIKSVIQNDNMNINFAYFI